MAKNNPATATAATAKRRGRPTNAAKAAAAASQTNTLIDIAVAAASAAVKTALGTGGIDGIEGVTTVATVQPSSGSNVVAKKAPGRKRNPESNMSRTRALYAANMNKEAGKRMTRAEFVKAAAAKLGYSVQTANTYVSTIERGADEKLESRNTATA